MPNDNNTKQTFKELFAGSVGGITQVLTGQPFDTVKVRLQTQPTPPIYSGVSDCVKKIASQEGPFGFYKVKKTCFKDFVL
jgi:solute carrier family 25 carnitine/acylcarnitine transporter 20/29